MFACDNKFLDLHFLRGFLNSTVSCQAMKTTFKDEVDDEDNYAVF